MSLAENIHQFRTGQNMSQLDLADALEVSRQSVSKWETDQTCPDISLLPQLAKLLGVSVDELLSGKQESAPAVRMLPEAERKDIGDMMLRVVMTSADGDSLRVNLPLALVEVAINSGIPLPQFSGNEALKSIDWAQIFELVKRGAIGNLVDAESSDGDVMQIFVE